MAELAQQEKSTWTRADLVKYLGRVLPRASQVLSHRNARSVAPAGRRQSTRRTARTTRVL